jgi:hypothetical protein
VKSFSEMNEEEKKEYAIRTAHNFLKVLEESKNWDDKSIWYYYCEHGAQALAKAMGEYFKSQDVEQKQ